MGPKNSAAKISGRTMKKLNTPMYTPMRWAGSALESIAYGIDRIDAQAIPTPIIDTMSIMGSRMNQTLSNPAAPQSNAPVCTVLRLVAAAARDSVSATMKQVIE